MHFEWSQWPMTLSTVQKDLIFECTRSFTLALNRKGQKTLSKRDVNEGEKSKTEILKPNNK